MSLTFASASAFMDEMSILSSHYMYAFSKTSLCESVLADNDISISEDVESELSNEESIFYQRLIDEESADIDLLTTEDILEDEEYTANIQDALEAYLEYKLEEDYDW